MCPRTYPSLSFRISRSRVAAGRHTLYDARMGVWISAFAVFGLVIALDGLVRFVALFSFRAARGLSGSFMVPTARRIFSILKAYTGLRMDFEGLDRRALPPRFLVVCNHQSLFDIPVLLAFFGDAAVLRFVAKRELGRFIPFVSQALRYQRHALIGRDGSARGVMRELEAFARITRRDGASPVLFPEGTRSKDGDVHAFHSAGFRKILELDPVPVVTVAIDGLWNTATLGAIRHGFRGVVFRVKLLSVAETPADKQGQLACLERARREIAGQVALWRGASDALPGR